MRRIDVPEIVRRKAATHGAIGLRWLRNLESLVAELERDWGLEVGSTLLGGTDAYVAEATTRDGGRAVLKLGIPAVEEGWGFTNEIRTLRAADGQGYARLLRHDEPRAAVLLERLGPKLNSLGLSVEDQLRVICTTLREAWIPAPAEVRLPTGAEKAASLAEFIGLAWEDTGHPCSKRVIHCALAFAATRAAAFDPSEAVLAHGDAHSANTLQDVGEKGFKFIDPDGLITERAYDLAIPMREWGAELLVGDALELGRRRCALLSRLTGVEPGPIWEWGFVERVSTGLLLLQVGHELLGREFLDVAEVWAAPA